MSLFGGVSRGELVYCCLPPALHSRSATRRGQGEVTGKSGGSDSASTGHPRLTTSLPLHLQLQHSPWGPINTVPVSVRRESNRVEGNRRKERVCVCV